MPVPRPEVWFPTPNGDFAMILQRDARRWLKVAEDMPLARLTRPGENGDLLMTL